MFFKRKSIGRSVGLAVLTVLLTVAALTLTACKHQHQFSDEWQFDDIHHWRAAVCEHSDQVADRAQRILPPQD